MVRAQEELAAAADGDDNSASLLRPFSAAVLSPSLPQAQKCSFLSMKPQLLVSSDPSPSASQRMGPSWRRFSPSWPQPMPSSGRARVRPHLARRKADLYSPSPLHQTKAASGPYFMCASGAKGGAGAQALVLPQLRVVTLTPSICQHFPLYQLLPCVISFDLCCPL